MKLKMSREVDLGKNQSGHLLFILAVPSITSQVVNALYNMVDRMYIGHIAEVGSTALTGVGVCFPIIMIVSAFAALMGMGGAPRASISMGKKTMKPLKNYGKLLRRPDRRSPASDRSSSVISGAFTLSVRRQ